MTFVSLCLHSKFPLGIHRGVGTALLFPCSKGSWQVTARTAWLVESSPYFLQGSKTQRPSGRWKDPLSCTLKGDVRVLAKLLCSNKKGFIPTPVYVCVSVWLCVCVSGCVYLGVCVCVHVFRSKDNFQELVLSFYWCGFQILHSGDRLGFKCLFTWAELFIQTKFVCLFVCLFVLEWELWPLEVCIWIFIQIVKMAKNSELSLPWLSEAGLDLMVRSPQVAFQTTVQFSFRAMLELGLTYTRITWRFTKISVLFFWCATDYEGFFTSQALKFAFHQLLVWSQKNWFMNLESLGRSAGWGLRFPPFRPGLDHSNHRLMLFLSFLFFFLWVLLYDFMYVNVCLHVCLYTTWYQAACRGWRRG